MTSTDWGEPRVPPGVLPWVKLPRVPVFARFAAAACLALALLGARADSTGRFSQWLPASEFKACGLDRLNSDQVASLDALVRAKGVDPQGDSRPFSQRLSGDESRAAGMDQLTAAQRSRLDGDVARSVTFYVAPGSPVAVIPPPPGEARFVPEQGGPLPPDVHGSVTLGFGGGSGYSDVFGAMDMNYTDPSHQLTIDVGMSEDKVSLPSQAATSGPQSKRTNDVKAQAAGQ